MTWREWMAARQLLVEERFGVLLRRGAAEEDATFAAAASNIRP